jgi:protein O-mannosyl-transferase
MICFIRHRLARAARAGGLDPAGGVYSPSHTLGQSRRRFGPWPYTGMQTMHSTLSSTPSIPFQDVPLQPPRHWLLCLSVAILAAATMANAITGPFLMDDRMLIHGNHYVHGFEHWRNWFQGTLWDTNYYGPDELAAGLRYWRPVVLLSYAVDWWLGGGSPLTFHVTNTLLHAINCAFAYHLFSGWVPGRLGAWLGAATFAVHPVQTESVALITSRTDSLCLLGLLVVIAGIRARHRFRHGALVLQFAGLFIAFGSKEAAVVLPVLAFIEFWSRERQPLRLTTLLPPLRATLPYLALAIVFLGCYLSLAHSQRAAEMSGARHAAFVLEAWGRYAALVFWPDDLTLGRALIHYDAEGAVPVARYAVLGSVAAIALLVTAWRLRHFRPVGSLALLAYALMSLPVSGIVWLGYDVVVSPRFLYLPMLGIALFVAACVSGIERHRSAVTSIVVAVLIALSIRSWVRTGDFGSEDDFWRAELTRNPEDWGAQDHFIVRELEAGRPRNALMLSHHWFRQAASKRGVGRKKAELVLNAVEALLALTPDIDRQSLGAVAAFVNSLALGSAATLELPRLSLELKTEGDIGMLRSLASARRRLQLMAADATSRIGDDAAALRAVAGATAGCERCWILLPRAAIAVARAGDLTMARAFASDAERFAPPGNAAGVVEALRVAGAWHERERSSGSAFDRVGFYMALGAYGRAYSAAERVLEQTPDGAVDHRSLAQLAMYAGDVDAARRWLDATLPSAEVPMALAQLASMAPWKDRPMPSDTWLPILESTSPDH